MERSQFIKSTFILVLANTVAKILGAVFKIPLSYILKEEGMAIYQTAFSVYSVFLSFIISGFPFAATKLLSEYHAKGEKEKVKPLVMYLLKFLSFIGILASIIMYLLAPYISVAMKEQSAAMSIKLLAPSIFLVAASSVIKSSNEAGGTLIPTAFSQVTEALFKLFLGLYLAYKLSVISLVKSSEGAIFSVTVGELFATSFLILVWVIKNKKEKSDIIYKSEIKDFFKISIPLMLTVFASSLMSIANITAIRHALSDIIFTKESAESFLRIYAPFTNSFDSLLDTMRLTESGARKLFGAYSGYAETVFNLPLGIIATISSAATPMFARAISKQNKDVSISAKKVLSAIFTLSIPTAFIMFFFSGEILSLIFNNTFSSLILKVLSLSVIFITTNGMLISILHLSGKIFEPFLAIITGQLIKIVISSFLIRIPYINILGVPASIFISSFITFLLLYIIFKKTYKCGIGLISAIYKPLSATLIMTGIALPIYKYILNYYHQKLSFILVMAVSGILYILLLYIFNKKKIVITKTKGAK